MHTTSPESNKIVWTVTGTDGYSIAYDWRKEERVICDRLERKGNEITILNTIEASEQCRHFNGTDVYLKVC